MAIGTVSVALASGLLVFLPLDHAARTLLEGSLRERAEAAAEMIGVAMDRDTVSAADQGDPAAIRTLTQRLRDLTEEADLDVASLVHRDGRLMVSTDPRLKAGAQDPVWVTAGASVQRVAEMDAETTPVRLDVAGKPVVAAVAVIQGVTPPIFVAVYAPAGWSTRLDTLRLRMAAAIGAWTALVAVAGTLLTRRALRPLRRLGQAANALASGEDMGALPRSGLLELDTLADDFDRMRGAIASRERWLRALAATVAHEVRNPAHALHLHLGLLRRAVPETEALARRLDTLDGELDELDASVTSLLAFAEGAPAQRGMVDVPTLLRRAAPDAEIDADPGEFALDAVLVGRAVATMVRNARQAGATHIVVHGRRVAGALRIEVEDDGAGFPTDMVGRALEPFAHGATGGSGIGLALVHAVARAHGGDARIAKPGPNGTVVEMSLQESGRLPRAPQDR